MPDDNKDPTIDMLMDKLKETESKLASLQEENTKLASKLNNVVDLNRSLLKGKTPASDVAATPQEIATKNLYAYLKQKGL